MPLTSGSVTIKTAGGDYSSWAAFLDDLGNLTGDITCTVDASAFTEGTAPAGVTESLGGYTLHVLPASFPTTTDASTGARFTCNYSGMITDLQMEGPGTVEIEGIVFIEGTSEPSRAVDLKNIGTAFLFRFRRNIIKGCLMGIQQNDDTISTIFIYNNILLDVAVNSIYFLVDSATAFVANNTVVNGLRGVYATDKSVTFENNLCYGSGGADFLEIEINTIGNNNANSDHTGDDVDWGGGGANNVYLDVMSSNPFNDLGADDFTISEAGGALIGSAGKDLSGTFTTDFFGVTRLAWTIGACEWVDPNITVSLEATGEGEADIGISLKHPAEVTGEGEAAVGVSIQLGIEATGEGEVSITTLLNFIQAVEATGEGEAEIGIALQTLLEATGEGEVSISTLIIIAIVELTANMNFSGSISAQNPNWLLLDDSLAWREEWDETVTYDPFDAVLYKTADGGEWHVFVSKVSHNIGNIPTTSPAYWRRYYQEQFV